MRLIVLLMVLGLAACGQPSKVGPVRFANAEPVWRVNDRVDVPKAPAEYPYRRMSFHFNSYYKRMIRGLNLTRDTRAQGVNALDEVPDSTWFTNRLGVRTVTPEEIERGPGKTSPEQYKPWTIKSSKSGGRSLGFVAEDTRGVKFLLKFDRANKPEIETATDAIVARLIWAIGYNVSSDHVVYFRREDLQISPKATTKSGKQKVPLTAAMFDEKIATITREPDGRIRGIASIFIEGEIVGGVRRTGVRRDDPNDTIPHQHRRDQRGHAAPFAWLSHTDMREDQTLDTWQSDPANKAVHYVVHYLVDFGNALDAALAYQDYLGHEYDIDLEEVLASTLSMGLYRRGGEDRDPSKLTGVGLYTTKGYDPGHWKPNNPGHFAMIWSDRFDKFWGAKILIRFTREQIAAAIKAGRLSDPRAAAYLLDTLIERQRMTARHWFARVNPVDEFSIAGDQLCFTELAMRHRFAARASFTISTYDASGRDLQRTVTAEAGAQGRTCVTVALAPGTDSYTILRIESSRGMPGTMVHLAVDPATRKPRVIGLRRL